MATKYKPVGTFGKGPIGASSVLQGLTAAKDLYGSNAFLMIHLGELTIVERTEIVDPTYRRRDGVEGKLSQTLFGVGLFKHADGESLEDIRNLEVV